MNGGTKSEMMQWKNEKWVLELKRQPTLGNYIKYKNTNALVKNITYNNRNNMNSWESFCEVYQDPPTWNKYGIRLNLSELQIHLALSNMVCGLKNSWMLLLHLLPIENCHYHRKMINQKHFHQLIFLKMIF